MSEHLVVQMPQDPPGQLFLLFHGVGGTPQNLLPLGRRLSADVGYLNQYRLARGVARAQMDHALTVQLTINAGGGAKLDD